MIAARTDVVGSLLRPRELLEARKCLERGEVGPSEFKREYIQLDAPHYPLLLDSGYRDFYASRGWPAERRGD